MFATDDHARLVNANRIVDVLNTKWAETTEEDDWNLLSRNAAIFAGGDVAEIDMSDGSTGHDGPVDPELKADIVRLHDAYGVLLAARDAGYDETFTQILLDYSLCPMHQGDYASCFDDDNPECAAIRTIHPSHDT